MTENSGNEDLLSWEAFYKEHRKPGNTEEREDAEALENLRTPEDSQARQHSGAQEASRAPEASEAPGSHSGITSRLAALLATTRQAARTILNPASRKGSWSESATGSESPGNATPTPGTAQPMLPDMAALKSLTRKVARTILDYGAIADMANRAVGEKDKRLSAELEARAAEPPKPRKKVERYKSSSTCPASGIAGGEQERVTVCAKCQLFVYDFTEMDQAEAQKAVFQRENRREVVLYRRKDGKFLSRDCRIGARRGLMTAVGSAACAVLFSGFLAALMLQPAPRKVSSAPPAAAATGSDQQSATAGAENKSSAGSAAARLTSQEQLEAYARRIESFFRSRYTPSGKFARSSGEAVVLRVYISSTGAPSGFVMTQSSGDTDLDKYVIRAVVRQTYPAAPPMPCGVVIAELTVDGGKVNVTLPRQPC